MKKNLLIPLLAVIGFIFAVYRNWFLTPEIIGGDWPYVFQESIRNLPLFVPSWSSWQGNGLGGTNPAYFIQSYQFLTFFLSNTFHIPWSITARIFWFGMFLVLSISSSLYLIQTIKKDAPAWIQILTPIIYTTNTYILMIVGGGQMGVALSYAIAPFVVAFFLRLFLVESTVKTVVITMIFLGIELAFDPRIAYITIVLIAVIYTLLLLQTILSKRPDKLKSANFLKITLLSVCVGIFAILLNMYWILPMLILKQNPIQELGSSYSSTEALRFFSFAQFPQTLSLLHPNWPENIFGKVGFMKPEFLLLPILAFSSLLFVKKEKDQRLKITVLFFCFLSLLGAFLAKGANPPFGELYIWMFEHIPGFIMFRDPTKWYLMTALAFSVLIPVGLWQILEILSSRYEVLSIKYKAFKSFGKRSAYTLILTSFFLLWIFLIRPVFIPGLWGTFENRAVPSEYVSFKNIISKDDEFYRVLWVPRQSRFGFISFTHPSIEGQFLFSATNSAQFLKVFRDPKIQVQLANLSVRYVVIPYDSMGDIFVEDRKYDHNKRLEMEETLDRLSWLKKVEDGKLTIYQTLLHKDHFFLTKEGKVTYTMKSPDEYDVHIVTNTPNTIVFSENFNSAWIAKTQTEEIKSQKYQYDLNNFVIKRGNYDITIYNSQKIYYIYGRVISGVTALLLIVFLFSKPLFSRIKMMKYG